MPRSAPLTYDDNGSLISIADANGTTLYSWNARNQLAAISGPSVNASFVYHGMGRREKKTINNNLTEFLYDNVNPVQETSGAVVLANILTDLGIDGMFTRNDIGAATTSHMLTNDLGSIIALADSIATIQTEYTYEPFGATTAIGASNTNTFQYTGRENDGTGLYYYRARYYHPQLQRFISEDPLSCEVKKGRNLYSYVVNNPIDLTDPSGLTPGGGKEACDYYDEQCQRSKSSKSGGPFDDYACGAGDCYRAWSEGPKENCVRECLIEQDAKRLFTKYGINQSGGQRKLPT